MQSKVWKLKINKQNKINNNLNKKENYLKIKFNKIQNIQIMTLKILNTSILIKKNNYNFCNSNRNKKKKNYFNSNNNSKNCQFNFKKNRTSWKVLINKSMQKNNKKLIYFRENLKQLKLMLLK